MCSLAHSMSPIGLLFSIIPGQPAVDEIRRTCNIVSVRGRQKGSESSHIVRLSQSSDRNLRQQCAELLWVIEELGINRGFNRSWCNGVNSNTKLPEFYTQITGQHFEPAFAHAISG